MFLFTFLAIPNIFKGQNDDKIKKDKLYYDII